MEDGTAFLLQAKPITKFENKKRDQKVIEKELEKAAKIMDGEELTESKELLSTLLTETKKK